MFIIRYLQTKSQSSSIRDVNHGELPFSYKILIFDRSLIIIHVRQEGLNIWSA